jgi:hypothetical protein
VNPSGDYVIRLQESGKRIEFLTGFSEGLAGVSMQVQHPDGSIEPGMWGFIDHTGKWSILPSYAGAGEFHEGLAAVIVGRSWGYIDKTNKLRNRTPIQWGFGIFGRLGRREAWKPMGLH